MGKLTTAIILFVSLIIISCKDDEQSSGATATVQFATEEQTISEGGGAVSITIDFNRPASKNGTIEVELAGTAVYATDFNTRPNGSSGAVSITVTEGQTAAQFTVHPINNALLADDKTIEVTISDASNIFDVGAQNSILVTITDDEGPTEANFAISSSAITEGLAAGTDVTINLTSPAPGTGSVTVDLSSNSAVYGVDYTTEPAATSNRIVLPVAQSATSVIFKVKPVDNVILNATDTITMALTTDGVIVNTGDVITTRTLRITDDEIASQAAFSVPSSSFAENVTAGLDVTIALTPETTQGGTLKVSIDSDATYGDDFEVDGVTVTNGAFILNVPSGETTATFKVLPVDNAVNNESIVITFTISDPTGILTIGSTALTHEVTIVDDEIDPVLVTIADVRALYQGSAAEIETGAFIQATVTSAIDNTDGQTVFVQDATGGIALQFTSANSTLALGDEIKVKIGDENTGVQVNSTLGLIHIEGLAYSLVEETGTGGTVTPEVITVAQANSGTYQGKVVTVSNVYIKEANGTKTYGGTNTLSNGTDEIVTFVRNSGSTQASFKDDVAAEGIGAVTGVMTTGAGSTPQLLLRGTSDVSLTLTGDMTIAGTINDFGGVDNGVVSTAQQFTVQGTGLTNNVLVTAPTSFQISADNISYGTSLNLDFATVNAGPVSVYVKFAPATGVDGLKTGSLILKSYGAAAENIAVSGTETSSTLKMVENFDYTIGGLTANSGGVWTENSGGGTNNIPVVAGGLTFTGYPSSGAGNQITFATTGQDAFRTFTTPSVTSGNLYVSFLINVQTAQAAGDYFFGFLPDNSTSNYTARTFIKSSGTGFVLGLSKGSVGANETAVYGTTEYSFNTTYLVVVKYSFVGGTVNDVANIFVVDGAIPVSEPGVQSVGPTVSNNADQTNLGRVAIRQGGAANTPTLKMSGIRVAQAWDDLF